LAQQQTSVSHFSDTGEKGRHIKVRSADFLKAHGYRASEKELVHLERGRRLCRGAPLPYGAVVKEAKRLASRDLIVGQIEGELRGDVVRVPMRVKNE